MTDIEKYPVKWLVDVLEHPSGRKGSLCICGYSKRVWYMTPLESIVTPLIIQNINTIDGVCADGAWCLDTQCKYNRTTPESYCEANNIPEEEREWMKSGWSKLIERVKKFGRFLEDMAEFEESVIEQYPEPIIVGQE